MPKKENKIEKNDKVAPSEIKKEEEEKKLLGNEEEKIPEDSINIGLNKDIEESNLQPIVI